MKRFLLIITTIAVLVLCALIVKNRLEDSGLPIYNAFFGIGEVKAGSYPNWDMDTWNPIIADYVNRHGVKLVCDGENKEQDVYPVYMNQNGKILIPDRTIETLYDCAAYELDGNTLEMIRNGQSFVCFKDSGTIVSGETTLAENVPVEMRGEQSYYGAESIGQTLGYSVNWDGIYSTLEVFGEEGNTAVLPERYDYREIGRKSVTKDQANQGTCWAAAATTAMESTLLPREGVEFSVDHMSLNNHFSFNVEEGGNYAIAVSYLTSWKGPVYEWDDPYGDSYSPEGLSPVKHIQEIRFLGRANGGGEAVKPDPNEVKQMLYRYGAIETALYFDLENEYSYSPYYNSGEAAYCYNGDEGKNHAVVIIGWDDHYPAGNFPVDVPGDGAYICQNSWGSNFGVDGVFYVSYYDSRITEDCVVYSRIENISNYDQIYQSDLCGWTGQLGYESETAYFANVYTAAGQESAGAAGFYAVAPNTSYEVYFVSDFTGMESLTLDNQVASGKLSEAGYYTIPFWTEQKVTPGGKFACIVKITTPDAMQPVAVEMQMDELSTVKLDDGEGYISPNGGQWTRVEEDQGCNNCLKVYTGIE